MAPRVEVVGIYPVPEAEEPCHLIELKIRDSPGFDISQFEQEDPDQRPRNWQVAYDARVLNGTGDDVLTDDRELRSRSELLQGNVRVTFFLHYLDSARALLTPFGPVALPQPSERPPRLRTIDYEPAG